MKIAHVITSLCKVQKLLRDPYFQDNSNAGNGGLVVEFEARKVALRLQSTGNLKPMQRGHSMAVAISIGNDTVCQTQRDIIDRKCTCNISLTRSGFPRERTGVTRSD